MAEQKKWSNLAELGELLSPKQRQQIEKDRQQAERPTLIIQICKRKHRLVTQVLHLNDSPQSYLKKLKKLLGCGGTLADGILEFQGDHREKIAPFFEKDKFRIKVRNSSLPASKKRK